ncbi:hypothetical protein H6F43_03240 [Leptolyngbya sp. FACHB-36]|uniref:hypothetical protein n=1 Tax=Leptolyngbya sp. FACHB-36 TaxID=2692808 RepID=UPI00168188B8|nr:hypothetical protein [Leptolyngbya sp. FACHB-36]MBD2019198.1 hypothetical protein [Leptolyngbya sp. FACHB-36]
MQDLLTHAATAVEIAIAFTFVAGLLTMPRRKVSPGQLELDFTEPTGSFLPVAAAPMEPAAEIEAPIAPMEPDPWETPATVSPLPTIAPLYSQPPHLLLLPALPAAKTEAVKHTPKTLRDLCQRHGIKWRNAHGKNRHLSVQEMRSRLAGVQAIA